MSQGVDGGAEGGRTPDLRIANANQDSENQSLRLKLVKSNKANRAKQAKYHLCPFCGEKPRFRGDERLPHDCPTDPKGAA